MSPDTRSFVLALGLFKVGYIALILLAIWLFSPLYNAHNYAHARIYRVDSDASRFELAVIPWDAGYYLSVSRFGYAPHSPDDAFYPLWPAFIKVALSVAHGKSILAADVLANIVSFFALIALYRFLRERWAVDTARRTLFLFIAFPGALFLAFPYSEALLLLFCTVALTQLMRGDYSKAGIAGFLAALTSPVGVLLAVPIAVDAIRKHRPRQLVWATLPFVSVLAVMVVEFGYTRNVLEPLQALRYLSAATMSFKVYPISVPALDRLWFLACLPLLWKLYRIDKTMFAYSFAMAIVPAFAFKFEAFTRYVLMAFPLFVVVAQRSMRSKLEYWYYATLAFLFGLQILMLMRHINFIRVG